MSDFDCCARQGGPADYAATASDPLQACPWCRKLDEVYGEFDATGTPNGEQ